MAKARVLQDRSEPGIVLDVLLLQSWEIAHKAERKSPRTIHIYLTQARRFMEWCAALDSPPRFDRRSIQAFLAAESDRGLSPNTVVTRYTGLRQLAVWLHDEGETTTMVMAGMKKPSTTYVPPEVLDLDQIKAMLHACEGTRFYDRRDLACLRLLIDTGARASEIVNLGLVDVNLSAMTVTERGKGDRIRSIPFGTNTARALDRYLRMRRQHPHAASDRLWIGERGPWTYDGMGEALRTRAKQAGVDTFHPHLLRHTLAHRWLAKGGSEQGLMDVAGWRSREMLARYGASARAERAAAEHRRLGLGEDV